MRLLPTISRLWLSAACLALVLAAPDARAASKCPLTAWPLCVPLEGRLSPSEERLLSDAADGRWDDHSLFEAALVAGGMDDREKRTLYEARFDAQVAALQGSGDLPKDVEQRAAAVFTFLHREILTGGYQPEATDLPGALDHGRFNCVSSSVLFQCLARHCDLTVCGLESPGHVKTRLFVGSRVLDVETTCPTWFRALDGASGEISEAAGPGRELSPTQLVAMIYYNRGIELLLGERFAEAAAANAMAVRLDPTSVTAHGNLLATWNNWALDLGNRGRYAESVELLVGGMALEPDFAGFKTNFVHVHHRWTETLLRAGNYAEALRLLDQATRTVPNEPYFDQAQAHVRHRWATSVGTTSAGPGDDR